MRWMQGTRFFFKLAIICGLAVFLTLYPGDVSLKWVGYQVEMPIAVLFTVFFAFTAICIFLHHFWRKIWDIPKRYYQFLQKRRQHKGEKLLIESLTAISAHQPEEAQSSIELAKVLLPNHPLTVFVAAQSAHMLKDNVKAAQYFESMLHDTSMRFLGLRGLILLAKDQHDWVQVDHLLKQALALRPDSPWVQQEILGAQLHLAQNGQEKTISTHGIHRYLPKKEWHQHQALMLWSQAEKVRDDQAAFRTLCQKAHVLAPENIVISVNLARTLVLAHHHYKAQKVLLTTYKHNPHRDLGYAWSETFTRTEPIQQYKQLEKLTSIMPNHPETWWIMAEAAKEAQLWGQARRYLETILAYGDNQSACRLMAEIEEAEYPYNREVIHEWWLRAYNASKQEGWYCKSCAYPSDTWQITCHHCGSINRIEWRTFGRKDNLLLLSS